MKLIFNYFHFLISERNPKILPFNIDDEDSHVKLRYLLNGKFAYYEMRHQHQNHVLEFLSEQYVRPN